MEIPGYNGDLGPNRKETDCEGDGSVHRETRSGRQEPVAPRFGISKGLSTILDEFDVGGF
jgi:hypothetical protein